MCRHASRDSNHGRRVQSTRREVAADAFGKAAISIIACAMRTTSGRKHGTSWTIRYAQAWSRSWPTIPTGDVDGFAVEALCGVRHVRGNPCAGQAPHLRGPCVVGVGLAPRTARGGRSAWAMRHGCAWAMSCGARHVRGTPCAGHAMCGASPAPTMRRGRKRPRSGRCRPRRGSCRTAPPPVPAAPRRDSRGDASRPAGCTCSGSRRAG